LPPRSNADRHGNFPTVVVTPAIVPIPGISPNQFTNDKNEKSWQKPKSFGHNSRADDVFQKIVQTPNPTTPKI